MSFREMRSRATFLIETLLEQLEAKSPEPLTMQDMGAIEKAVKTIEILEEAEERSGKANPHKDKTDKELEGEFD